MRKQNTVVLFLMTYTWIITSADLIAKYPNKSTTVFSHCTFPKDKQDKEAAFISPIEPKKTINRPRYKLPISERLKRPPHCDTLKLFHSVSEKTTKKQEKIVGLGKLPSWLDNVGDCLLFNTDTNPYLRYESIDALLGTEGVDKAYAEKNMFQAPTTIRDKTNLIDKETYDIAYRPDLEHVPTFQVNTTSSKFEEPPLTAGKDETLRGVIKPPLTDDKDIIYDGILALNAAETTDKVIIINNNCITNSDINKSFSVELKQELYELSIRAFSYQVQSIEWMIKQERDEYGLYKYLFTKGEFKTGEKFMYSSILNRLVISDTLLIVHGGWLCEEMGLGTIIEIIALMNCNKRNDPTLNSTNNTNTNTTTLSPTVNATISSHINQSIHTTEYSYISWILKFILAVILGDVGIHPIPLCLQCGAEHVYLAITSIISIYGLYAFGFISGINSYEHFDIISPSCLLQLVTGISCLSYCILWLTIIGKYPELLFKNLYGESVNSNTSHDIFRCVIKLLSSENSTCLFFLFIIDLIQYKLDENENQELFTAILIHRTQLPDNLNIPNAINAVSNVIFLNSDDCIKMRGRVFCGLFCLTSSFLSDSLFKLFVLL